MKMNINIKVLGDKLLLVSHHFDLEVHFFLGISVINSTVLIVDSGMSAICQESAEHLLYSSSLSVQYFSERWLRTDNSNSRV